MRGGEVPAVAGHPRTTQSRLRSALLRPSRLSLALLPGVPQLVLAAGLLLLAALHHLARLGHPRLQFVFNGLTPIWFPLCFLGRPVQFCGSL